jgi:hypothetical protein
MCGTDRPGKGRAGEMRPGRRGRVDMRWLVADLKFMGIIPIKVFAGVGDL